jgi:hypothetical protein
MRKAFILILAALGAGGVQAQDVYYYQSIMPDGRTVVGDKPAPGAKEVRKMPLRSDNVIAVPPAAAPAAPAQPAADREATLAGADSELRGAELELKAAQAALQAGQEPQPGERIGTVGGTSRLTDAYFDRIKRLEDAVAAAQKKVADAQARRNAARY